MRTTLKALTALALCVACFAATTWNAASFNILVYSRDYSQSLWWDVTLSTATGGQTAPDGSSTATSIVNNASSSGCYVRHAGIAVTGSSTYTLEVTVKSTSGQWFQLNLSDWTANAFGSYFDLVNGVTGTTTAVGAATLSSKSITSLGSGWYRLVVTGSTGVTGAFYYQANGASANNTNSCHSGDTVSQWNAAFYRGSSAPGYSVFAAPQKYQYFGFVGTTVDTLASTQSSDASTFNVNGLGYTYWAGQVNAPRVFQYKGDWFFHVATANDLSLHLVPWLVGKVNQTTGVVTTVATIDWTSSISGVNSCFSGRFFVSDGDGVVHIFVPCSITDLTHMIIYESHATNTALTTWSSPVAITGTLPAAYDPMVVLVGTTYYLWYHDWNTGFICLATSSSLTGAYTPIKTGNWAGWGTSALEALDVFHAATATGWRAIFEDYTSSHIMYYSDCNSSDFITCTWTAKTAWTEAPMLYRNGDVIRWPGSASGSALSVQ